MDLKDIIEIIEIIENMSEEEVIKKCIELGLYDDKYSNEKYKDDNVDFYGNPHLFEYEGEPDDDEDDYWNESQ